jgi:hypothetical protein
VQEERTTPQSNVGETAGVAIRSGDGVLSAAWLNGVLGDSQGWPHGSIRVLTATQIGVEHGMSGRIHRVVVETERGGSRSLVVKQDRAEAVERELLFHNECATFMRDSIPACYGGTFDVETGRGALLLEDIAPAEQGDVLRGCTKARARSALSALARLHAGSWQARDTHPTTCPRWRAQPMELDRWLDRLGRAGERFPHILTRALLARLADLPDTVSIALDHLRGGPVSWVQLDTHLDNVLWRPDGTAVLLDWSNAAIGPPIADVARFLSEGVDAGSRAGLVDAYVRERQRTGSDTDLADVSSSLHWALLPLLQSAVGWAGREDLRSHGRAADVCERWLLSVCDWALGDGSRSRIGRRIL